MEKYYTVSTIAQRLSLNSRRTVSDDAVYAWIRQGRLKVERISGNIRGCGKYPYFVERAHLKAFLRELSYDVDRPLTMNSRPKGHKKPLLSHGRGNKKERVTSL